MRRVGSVAVIGRGMIGSAAARHLAENGVATVLIGATEPADWSTWDGPFASHWDEGRVTRISSTDSTWSELAARSIRRYLDIESRSGVDFHAPRRFAWITPDAERAANNANDRGGTARVTTTEWLRAETGIRAVESTHPVCFEEGLAGLINPRRLVEAQVKLASLAGATIFEKPAIAILPRADGVEVRLREGSVQSDHVLLATGAYGAQLVGVELELERRLRTIVRAELGQGPSIPSLIADAAGQPELDGIYWVPPVRYPDGRTMLKIGGDMLDVRVAHSDEDLRSWFHSSGDPIEAAALRAALRTLLPGAAITQTDHQPCTTVYTPGGWPFIGPIDDRVTIAVGGSGAAAKSSDELGRQAALAATADDWHDPVLDLDNFTPIIKAN